MATLMVAFEGLESDIYSQFLVNDCYVRLHSPLLKTFLKLLIRWFILHEGIFSTTYCVTFHLTTQHGNILPTDK